jgi:hypothetical protein
MKRPSRGFERKEIVYVLEVAGVRTLAFQALSIMDAKALPRELWLQNDLREACSDGAPLWDGLAKLTVRAASTEEAARFKEAKSAAIDGSDDLVLVYLVELD